jgi:molybdate transport system substrate-binding protein
MKTCLILLALLAALVTPSRAEEAPLTILAASSLQDVLDEVEALYEKETGHAVRMAFDGSGVLARQIEKGAPADLFISASRDWMDSLVQQKRVDETTRVTIAGNRLVLVQPAPHDVFVQEPADLLRLTHIVMGDPDTVPAGRYAQQYLQKQGVWEQLEDRLTFVSSVRAALTLVERDEVGAAFVFATDARTVTSEPGLRTSITVDPAQHDPIVYEAAVVQDAPRRVAALKFLWVLETPEAKAAFEKYGFTPRN